MQKPQQADVTIINAGQLREMIDGVPSDQPILFQVQLQDGSIATGPASLFSDGTHVGIVIEINR